jgi:hypothetical protein
MFGESPCTIAHLPNKYYMRTCELTCATGQFICTRIEYVMYVYGFQVYYGFRLRSIILSCYVFDIIIPEILQGCRPMHRTIIKKKNNNNQSCKAFLTNFESRIRPWIYIIYYNNM